MTQDQRISVVLDLDGVVYLDDEGIPGVRKALQAIEREGHQLLYATNNSSKTPQIVVDQINHRTGFTADPAAVVTSSQAAAAYTAARHRLVHVVGSDALRTELEAAGLVVTDAGSADAVVVGLDREMSYETISDASSAIRGGAEFVATNIDATYPTPAGLVPGAGAVVAAIRTASGCEPVVCGKPEPIFRDLVEQRMRSASVWMVGDRLETDIALAASAGWTSVLTLTGVTAKADDYTPYVPDHVIDSIADLPALLADVITNAVHRR